MKDNDIKKVEDFIRKVINDNTSSEYLKVLHKCNQKQMYGLDIEYNSALKSIIDNIIIELESGIFELLNTVDFFLFDSCDDIFEEEVVTEIQNEVEECGINWKSDFKEDFKY